MQFNLSNPGSLSHPAFESQELEGIPAASFWARLSNYELIVASLKRGDYVQFGEHSFELGDFLGRGNTTHIWALANDPTKAIRIPFNALFLRATSGDDLEMRSKHMLQTYETLINSTHAVRIFDVDEANDSISSDPIIRYMVVQRVQGGESGDAFLRRISRGKIKTQKRNPSLKVSDFRKLLESDEADKINSLLSAMYDDGFYRPSFLDSGSTNFSAEELAMSKQYLWDTKEERWYLVDGL